MKTKRLYKFLRTDLKSDHGTDKDWIIGQWREERDIDICNKGFHASKTPLQALGYVKGEIIAEVEVRGKSIIQDDKECWSEMRIVKAWHWKKEDSVEMAILAAEQVIGIYEKEYPNDKRPREAIEAAKAYLKDPSDKNKQVAALVAAKATEAAEAASWAARAASWAARAASWAAEAASRAAAWAAAEAAAASWAAEAASWAAAEAAAVWVQAKARADKTALAKLHKTVDTWFLNKIKTLQPYE